MNPKRLAGFLNILLAAVLIFVALRDPVQKTIIGIGLLCLLIGILRLRKTPPGPLPPG